MWQRIRLSGKIIKMSNKFYHASSANRLVGGKIQFQVYDVGSGSGAVGVYATDNADEIALLDKLVAERRGISEIDQAEYSLCSKKKVPNSIASLHSVAGEGATQANPEGTSLKGKGSAVVVAEAETPPAEDITLSNPLEALVDAPVAPVAPVGVAVKPKRIKTS